MSSSFPVVLVLVIVLGLMAATWTFTRKGPNQTLIRTSVMLALACCYLMWMVTYLAQVHPLERRFPIYFISDLAIHPGFVQPSRAKEAYYSRVNCPLDLQWSFYIPVRNHSSA
ncbi:hypothetical protein K474DRAFT_1593363 [Panus rudis PR-1116 ss-1]|nr:hypothetical protein K474DRAFT_1593363 [Panus rudis PR-1116 ss-1]